MSRPGSSLLQLAGAFPRWARIISRVRWRLTAVVAVVAALSLASVLYGNCGLRGCPDVRRMDAYRPNGASVLLDRFGERYGDVAPFERFVVSLDSLGDDVANAFIAVEDRRFYRHRGVDWARVLGAAIANVRHGGVFQGSSTITMQLARTVFPVELPGAERTFRRKLNEARVAQLIERRFSKREILEMYLNHIYFGGGAYGIEAAARYHFGVSARALRLPEAAMLAALPRAPVHYDPRRHPEAALARRNLVLTRMEAQGFLTPTRAEEARATSLQPAAVPAGGRLGIPLGAYFIDVVRSQLEGRFGELLYRSRLSIFTTLDPVAQQAAERELELRLSQLDDTVRRGAAPLQGAVVMLDAHTGAVRALVGGRDPSTSRYNRAIHARRQVGSAFKPFVFAAALADGIPTSQHIADQPLRMKIAGSRTWEPQNYDGRFEGEVSLRQALVRSRNIPTVRLALRAGIGAVARTARNAGVQEPMQETPALSLGTVALSPLQLAVAYGVFASLGSTVSPRFVELVKDAHGVTVSEPRRLAAHNGLRPDVAYIINDILQDAVNEGTGTGVRVAGYRGVVAGKTGTTSGATDAWFVGYTPDYVTVVWIGYDQPGTLGLAATGGSLAAPVWGRMMRTYAGERGYPGGWQQPAGVIWRAVDAATGLVLAPGCLPQRTRPVSEVFIAGAKPGTACPHRDFSGDVWGRLGSVFGEHDVLGDGVTDGGARAFARRGREPLGADAEIRRQAGQRQLDIEDFLEQHSRELQQRARAEERREGTESQRRGVSTSCLSGATRTEGTRYAGKPDQGCAQHGSLR